MPGLRKYCFKHSSGEDIYLFTLRNAKGTEVMITNYGAIITAFRIKQKDGAYNDIVLGFDDIESYSGDAYLKQYPWFGAAIGRTANRIANSAFTIDGKKYQLTSNRGIHHLHGGVTGFDKKVWRVESFIQSPRPALTLELKSPDGDQGYPGNLDVTLQFELSEDDELGYEYFASTDQPTPVNLTHHSYFNLNNGTGTIKDHELMLHASMFLAQDENLMATGQLIAVDQTEHDFREFRTIDSSWNEKEGYDQSFLLDKTDDKLSRGAELRSRESGLELHVYTTDPVVHFYSGLWTPVVQGKYGAEYGPYSGLCLETHKHPNAINIPHFPNTILRPGEKYYQRTVYKVQELK
jgi:aldose 1-epimerase